MASTGNGPSFTLTPELRRTSTVVVLGSIMSILDTTIVAVALATLGRDFHVSVTTIQWVSTGYLLALAMVIPVTGWAVDRFGAKLIWMTSLPLRHRLEPVRPRLVGQLAHRLPDPPGHRRRHAAPGRPVDPGPRRRAPAHGPRHEHHRGAHGPRADPGAGHRRPHRVQLQLALDLLHQRAHRHRHAGPVQPLAAQVRHRRAVRLRLRHPRVLPAVPRPGRPRLRPGGGGHDGQLHQRVGPRQLRPRPRADDRVHPARAAHQEPAAGAAPLQGPQLRHRQHLHLRARRHAVRVHVPAAALLPDRPRPGGLGGRAPDGAPGHRRGVHHALGRQRDRPGRATARRARSASCSWRSATIPFAFVTTSTSEVLLAGTLFVRGLGLGLP